MSGVSRQDAIKRGRAHAYVSQQELRARLHERIDNAMALDVNAAYAAWMLKETEADAFVRWMATQAPPEACAGLVSWIRRNPAIAFAAYNPALLQHARKVAMAVAEDLNAGVAKIATELAGTLTR